MLRRKTPNGILSAAYDGTSVEQTDKPHASKHILLPVTTDYNIKHDLPLRSPAIGTNFNQPLQDPLPEWSPSLYFETGSGRAHDRFNSNPRALPQIDSMLNQISPLQPLVQYPIHGFPYGAVPGPSLQNPTVSNDQGPFGPYWHDGTFIPYQPAAMRDPRYNVHHGANWHNLSWPNVNNGITPLNTYQNSFRASQVPNPFGGVGRSLDFSLPPPLPQHRNLALDYQNQAFPTQLPQRTYADYGLSSSGHSTPVSDIAPILTPLASEFDLHSKHTQSREKVFAWAHSVYIDMLKFLQSTRKPHTSSRSQNGNHHHARPHIYPRPPRQPNANFSSSTANGGSTSTERSASNTPSAVSDVQAFSQYSQLQLTRAHEPSHHRSSSSSAWPPGPIDHNRHSWHQVPTQQYTNTNPHVMGQVLQSGEPMRPLRRMSGTSISSLQQSLRHETPPSMTAASALDAITRHCEESNWHWIDGILLGGCLAYALGDYKKAQEWYKHILSLDKDHVEAISNLAATLFALQQKQDAERYWRQAVKLRPSYFEAVEHLIGLLCGEHRGKEAVQVIEEVERALRYIKKQEPPRGVDDESQRSSSSVSESPSISDVSDKPLFDYDADSDSGCKDLDELPGSDQPGFGSSGYAIPGSENGRMLALVHAKGNMLYALHDNAGAAKAFENAVLIGAGGQVRGISSLIKHILSVVARINADAHSGPLSAAQNSDPILLPPDQATKTARICFPPHGDLPGLKYVQSEGMSRKAAISTTSNALLSLAKIFQDGMATNSPKASAFQTTYGVKEILALYYLSLALQPSPSTANNVGILLASVQQSAPSKQLPPWANTSKPSIPGLAPNSGVALALAYYNYGLLLDSRHAHLYTNLGSLLKDIGQLDVAISMYEQAVQCDGTFDIALANLANAVKDKGRISDAILFYRRAVKASPDFAEAVCGLANALNSVCGWAGRGGIAADGGSRDRWHVDEKGMLLDARLPGATSSGWIKRVVDLVEKQLADGEDWGRGIMDERFIEGIIEPLGLTESDPLNLKEKQKSMGHTLRKWKGQKWEGARIVRLVERSIRRSTWQWYQDLYKSSKQKSQQITPTKYRRPHLPSSLTVPAAPTVLPFHTFTCPMSAKQIRLISQRNGLRISCSTLKSPWLPSTVFEPPPPPKPYLRVGYVSSDFNNHPLAHLMQSVFGMHDRNRVKAVCYATTASDGSVHRHQIEKEAPMFYDASTWSAERLVKQITRDRIHILINLNGYTRGARNEVFAARAAPIQMAFMGFAGTLGAEWCDYLLADETAVPTDTLRPWRRNIDMEDQLVDENSGGSEENWIYGENIIYCRNTFFCCDHRQSAPDAQGRQLNWDEEQHRRWAMRKELFPNLPDDAIILGNFNQLYKIEPTTFRTWLRILQRLPKAILWLLRFPDLGETNLKQTAVMWAGPEVASRVMFTDVAQKHQHIARARVCDLFLDTPECNAHTTAADVLWSGTPLLTLPRYQYKMCSRMAASILKGALPNSPEGKQASLDLVATGEEDYEEKAVKLAGDCVYNGYRVSGRLSEIRKLLYEGRWSSALFDTKRWVRDLEDAYEIAWKRWEDGAGGDIWLQPQRGW